MREITSPDNPKIKFYKKLSESKKFRRENGLFTLEGARLVSDAASENAPVQTVFVTRTYSEKCGGTPPFSADTEAYLIPDDLGRKISSTDNAQGIFAVCRTLDKPTVSDIIKSGGRYILLHNIQDPGNLGTMIRTADAMGMDGVFLAECCELYNPKTVRSTMGSLFRVNAFEADFDEVFPLFGQRGVPTFAAVVDSGAVSLTDCDLSGGGAVLIGNEGNGLPDEISELCDVKLTIKMSGNVNSLNAAMAAGIIMWELTKPKGVCNG